MACCKWAILATADSKKLRSGTRAAARLKPAYRLFAQPSEEAGAVFAAAHGPAALWFTAGNHEEYELLLKRERSAGREANSFAADCYSKLRCVRDGHVALLPGSLRLGALWGIDDRAPRARQQIPRHSRMRATSPTSTPPGCAPSRAKIGDIAKTA